MLCSPSKIFITLDCCCCIPLASLLASLTCASMRIISSTKWSSSGWGVAAARSFSSLIELPLRYDFNLSKAVGVLKDYGFLQVDDKASAMAEVLQGVVHVDEARVLAIASTLKLSGSYNKMVRDNVESMKVDDRYKIINELFDSVREDLFALVKHAEDGKIDLGEKVSQAWMKLARGSPHKRFEKIYEVNERVQNDTKNSIGRHQRIFLNSQKIRNEVF